MTRQTPTIEPAQNEPAGQRAGFYTPREVVEGWREYLLRGAKEYRLNSLARPGSGDRHRLDVRYLKFQLVERFFADCPKHRGYKVNLLEHRAAATESAFAAWYESHRLAKVPAFAASPIDPDPTGRFVPMPLSKAVDAWNSKTENRHKQIRFSTAHRAAKRCYEGGDGLFAWRPEGKWHTNLNELGAWWTRTAWGGKR